MAIINKIIHRFIRPRDDYMNPTKELYNQIIPYNVQAYSYELKPNGDPTKPDDYIVRYVLGTGRSTYQQIADGLGRDKEGHAVPELSKEFIVNSDVQLTDIIKDLIQTLVYDVSYIASDVNGDGFATKAALDSAMEWYVDGQSVLPKVNDYTTIVADETHLTPAGTPQTTRYICTGWLNSRPVWAYQYVIANSVYTAGSGIQIENNVISTTSKFVYENEIPTSSEWRIEHNLNTYPSVTVVDSSGNVLECSIHYEDSNVCIVSMNTPCTGKVYLN